MSFVCCTLMASHTNPVIDLHVLVYILQSNHDALLYSILCFMYKNYLFLLEVVLWQASCKRKQTDIIFINSLTKKIDRLLLIEPLGC